MSKALFGTFLAAAGSIACVIGKYGTIVAIIAWLLGLMTLIPPVSFWWVTGMILTVILGLLSAVIGIALIEG